MMISGINLNREFKKTVFISVALHIFCFSFFTFTFVDRINDHMELPIDFLGSVLKDSDFLLKIQTTREFDNLDMDAGFLPRDSKNLGITSFHLEARKPIHKLQNVFVSRKPIARISSEFLTLESIGGQSPSVAEEIEAVPDWQKDLKLKVE